MDLEHQTQLRYDEIIEYLAEAPVDLSTAIYYDTLWDLSYDDVINEVISEAEARANEEKLKDYDEQD